MWIEYGCTGFLGICAVYDYRMKQLPLWLFLAFGIWGLFLQIVSGKLFTVSALGGFAPGAALFAAGRCKPEKVGEGDGLMLLVSGLYLGLWQNVETLLIALLLMAPVSLWMLFRKKWNLGTKIAFAPFLFAAYEILQLTEAAGI